MSHFFSFFYLNRSKAQNFGSSLRSSFQLFQLYFKDAQNNDFSEINNFYYNSKVMYIVSQKLDVMQIVYTVCKNDCKHHKAYYYWQTDAYLAITLHFSSPN